MTFEDPDGVIHIVYAEQDWNIEYFARCNDFQIATNDVVGIKHERHHKAKTIPTCMACLGREPLRKQT